MHQIIGRIDESLRQNMVKLDLRDKKILSYLSENSRIPLTQLKKATRLSRDSIAYRIDRLLRKNVIIGFFPIINLKRFGFFTFHTFLLLDERDKEKNKEFIAYLKSLPFVKNIIEYSDIWDLEIVTVAKNVWDYDLRFNEITSKYPDLILEKQKVQVIKGYNSIHLPYEFYSSAKHPVSRQEKAHSGIHLDDKDMAILYLLCQDGREHLHNIGEKVLMSPEAVSYRLKKMYDANVIRKYSALINLSAIGYHWFTFTMQTKTFNLEWDKKMKIFVREHPFIIRAVKTLGTWDFLFYVAAENPRQFHHTAKEIKQEFSEIIRTHDTLLTYKEHYFTPMPMYVIEDFRKSQKNGGKASMQSEFYKDIVE